MALPVRKVSKKALAQARRIREDLHRHPELGYQEERTASVIAAFLRDLGLDEVRTGVAETGVVGLLRGGDGNRTVALRADIDALPIREETGLPYASVHEGLMHACGHDGHTAILLAVARLLAGMREKLPGNVKFIFQPAEEGGAGGRRMVEEGVLHAPEVDAIFALHGSSEINPGQIRLAPIPNAAMMSFRVDISGRGAHGAAPHVSVDPILIGAQIVVAAQSIVSRETRPDTPAVISICAFNGGTKENIIPDGARLLGTIRAVEMPVLRGLARRLGRVARGVAKSLRGSAEFSDFGQYPPTVNDPGLLEMVRGVGTELLGRRNVLQATEQRMGAEDFSFYLSSQGGVPGVIFRLGVESETNLHTSRFDFGSAALEPGILMLANVALAALEQG